MVSGEVRKMNRDRRGKLVLYTALIFLSCTGSYLTYFNQLNRYHNKVSWKYFQVVSVEQNILKFNQLDSFIVQNMKSYHHGTQ